MHTGPCARFFATTTLPLSVAMVPSSPNCEVYDTPDRREVPIPKQQSNRFPNKQIPKQTKGNTKESPCSYPQPPSLPLPHLHLRVTPHLDREVLGEARPALTA